MTSRRLLLAFFVFVTAGLALAGGWIWCVHAARFEWRQAEAALGRHDLPSAAVHLDRHLEKHASDTAAWFLAGRTARRFGRFQQAEHYLDACQRLGGITEATRLEWSLLRVQQGDLSDVHTRLRMKITPDHPEAPLVLEALARGYLKNDRLHDYMEACDLWAKLQPDHPWPWLWRGGMFEQKNSFHEALADYQKALDLAPHDGEIRLALANLLARARQPIPAAEHFEHLLQRSPNDMNAALGLAGCWIEQGNSEAALTLLEPALALDSIPMRALFLRGKAALELRDAASAEHWLAQAVRQSPDDPEAIHQLVLALRAQGKTVEADRLAPRLESVRKDLARLREVIWLVAKHPEDAPPRHEAGVVALRLGRADEGVRWLESAVRARGERRPSHAALAEHFRRHNDPRAELHAKLAEVP